jgi:stress-induced morphogen
MNQIYKVEFVITDGKAVYPPLKIKEVVVKDKSQLHQAVWKAIWNNRQGYGVTKNFEVKIVSEEWMAYTN